MQQDSVAAFTEAFSGAGQLMDRCLPPAYLAPWAARGVLCAMRRVAGDVVAEQVPPEATGFVPELRAGDDASPEFAEQIAQRLATLVLAEPAAALQPILERRAAEWDAAARENWARFIASLML